jgi:hypothetical protein
LTFVPNLFIIGVMLNRRSDFKEIR